MSEPATDRSSALLRGRGAPGWLFDGIGGLAIVLSAFAGSADSDRARGTALAVSLGSLAVLAVVLAVGRRWPRAVLTVTVVGASVATAAHLTAPGYLLAVAVALYRFAVLRDRRTTFVVAAACAAVLAAVAGVAAIPAVWPASRILLPITLAGFGAAIGDATRSRREYVQAMTDRAERAERTRELEAQRRVTEERLRIARELHDAAAHQITAINLHAGVALNALPEHPAQASAALEVIRDAAGGVLTEISALLRVLRTSPEGSRPAEPVGGLERLPDLLAEFERSGLTIRADVTIADDVEGTAADVVALQVVREGLANALRHGRDRTADVTVLAGPAHVSIGVTNRADPAARTGVRTDGGHGLLGMRERVESVLGTMSAGFDADRFALRVELPVGADRGAR